MRLVLTTAQVDLYEHAFQFFCIYRELISDRSYTVPPYLRHRATPKRHFTLKVAEFFPIIIRIFVDIQHCYSHRLLMFYLLAGSPVTRTSPYKTARQRHIVSFQGM